MTLYQLSYSRVWRDLGLPQHNAEHRPRIADSDSSWAGKDSNLRTRMRTDLQSVAFNHSATCPVKEHAMLGLTRSVAELAEGLEPPTC